MSSETAEHDVLDLETEYWQAIKTRDIDAAMRLTDEACLITGAQGVRRIDRQEFEGMMKDTRFTLHAFMIKDAQVHLLGEDVAVLAYNVHEELTVDGEPVTIDAADASTWVRRNGRWLCALHTESIKGDPFGRDKVHV